MISWKTLRSVLWSHFTHLMLREKTGRTHSPFLFIEKKPGDTVVLLPGPVTPPITSITWDYDSYLTVDWYGEVFDYWDFIDDVPSPTVSMSCDDEQTHCVFTCEGNTTDSGPVTYSWKSGDVVKSQTKEFTITKKDTEASFVCTVENLFGSESSKAVDNPFATNYSLFWIRAILVVLFLVVGVGFIVFYTHKGNKAAASSLADSSEYVSLQDVRWS
ncbi:uncharacterized protein LOC125001027 [Mugil cephalus]|uniref:uncharacterized protein LOC125001027 n=1 Tax=Mugil cephalus TaxID=48193 RepID=UPI001FB81CB2|nr:uncharacterized protein LOC125001027 [Mugil cephalus]